MFGEVDFRPDCSCEELSQCRVAGFCLFSARVLDCWHVDPLDVLLEEVGSFRDAVEFVVAAQRFALFGMGGLVGA